MVEHLGEAVENQRCQSDRLTVMKLLNAVRFNGWWPVVTEV